MHTAFYSSPTHLSATGPIYGSQNLSSPSCASFHALNAAYRVPPTETTMKSVRRKAGSGMRRLNRRRTTRSGVVSRADWYAADKSAYASTLGDARDTCHGSGHSRCGSRGSRRAALRSSASRSQHRALSIALSATARTGHRPTEIGSGRHHIHPPSKATLPCIRPVILERASACSAPEKRSRLRVVGVRLRHRGRVRDCAARLVRAGVVGRRVAREPWPFGLGFRFGGHLGRVGRRDVGRRLVCSCAWQ